MTKEMTADLLVEDVKVREQYMNRVDVLDKVKKLLLLPELDMATTKMVADFYEVGIETVKSVLNYNKNEIRSDGYVARKGKDIVEEYSGLNFNRLSITKEKGGYLLNGETKLSYAGVGLFPRRAILRVGMLLRDSEVAKEVRTQLLNIEEKATAEVKVAEITEEDALLLAVMKAGSPEEISVAMSKYRSYTSRHVEKVEAKLAEVEKEKECHSLKMFSNFSYERINILGGENYGRK